MTIETPQDHYSYESLQDSLLVLHTNPFWSTEEKAAFLEQMEAVHAELAEGVEGGKAEA